MQHKGIDSLVLEVVYVEEGDLSGIEVVGQNGIDISLVSEYSKNILRQIAKNSNYTRVVIIVAQQERLDGKLKLCITTSLQMVCKNKEILINSPGNEY